MFAAFFIISLPFKRKTAKLCFTVFPHSFQLVFPFMALNLKWMNINTTFGFYVIFYTFSSFIGNKTKTKPSFAGLKNNVVFVCVSVSHCVCAHFSCQEVLSSLGRLSRCFSAVAGIPPETNSLAHSRTYLRLKKQRPAGDREKARPSAEGWRRSDK